LGTPVDPVSTGIRNSFSTFVDERQENQQALVLGGSCGARTGPRGKRVPFGPSHAALFVADFDKNEGGVVLPGLRSGECRGKPACVPDGCCIGHAVYRLLG
jgi:hypothetical protein